jgi:CheY-like chemotaxis protein
VTDRRSIEEQLRSFAGQLERLVDERTQELVQSQTRLRVLAKELNLAEQRERKRLAGELHDYLAQLLVLGCLKLGQVRRTGLPSKVEQTLKETEEVLTKALEYSRTLMAELSPPVLQEHGLPAGLMWLGEQMQRYGLMVRVDIGDAAGLFLPNDWAVLLFQSVRELLMNALKHSGCQNLYIRLQQGERRLCIEVRDDGIGFDLAAAALTSTTAMSSKLGLFSIRERMIALGGWLDLDSTPGEGTRAALVLPLSDEGIRGKGLERAGNTSESANGSPDDALGRISHASDVIRVLLVDDHAMVRQGLRTVLDSYADIEVVGEAWNGEDAVAGADRLHPAVVVMDINMPKKNGIEATRLIKERHPDIVVIGLSVQVGGENERAMKQAGGALLLTKEAAVDELYRVIQKALKTNV